MLGLVAVVGSQATFVTALNRWPSRLPKARRSSCIIQHLQLPDLLDDTVLGIKRQAQHLNSDDERNACLEVGEPLDAVLRRRIASPDLL